MTKQHILSEIRRTAQANGGLPVGWRKFRSETGIQEYDWCGKYWIRWNEAIQEAGFSTNTFTVGYNEEFLLKQFIALIRELGRFPLKAEMRMKRLKDDSFPSEKTFRQFGSKSVFAKKIVGYYRSSLWDLNECGMQNAECGQKHGTRGATRPRCASSARVCGA
jgi:hypothetical protein